MRNYISGSIFLKISKVKLRELRFENGDCIFDKVPGRDAACLAASNVRVLSLR